MSTINSYNRVAFVYEFLNKLVFGQRLKLAAVRHFERIPSGARILVLGGGTGWILEYLKEAAYIDFVEPSGNMMKRARKHSNMRIVHFHQVRFQDFNTSSNYDYIICNYFLDLFPVDELTSVIKKCRSHLNPTGKLIVTDFVEAQRATGLFNKLLVLAIICFCQITTRYPNKEIPPIQELLESNGFDLVATYNENKNLLFSSVYEPTSVVL